MDVSGRQPPLLYSLSHLTPFGCLVNRVEVESKGGVWQRDQKVRFKHFETQGYLVGNDRKYGRPIGGQHEVITSNPYLVQIQLFVLPFLPSFVV